MSDVADVWVVGGGFAGSVAASVARASGRSVLWTSAGPGGSTFWSGVADVHGPWVAPPPAQSPHRLERGAPAAASTPGGSVDARRARLDVLRPDHLYRRAGLAPADVAALVETGLDALGWALPEVDSDAVLVTDAATLRRADRADEAIARVTAGSRWAVLCPAALPGIDADWIAAAVDQAGATATPHRLGSVEAPLPNLAAAQRIGLARSLREAGTLPRVPAVDAVIVPPIFSADPFEADAERAQWADACGAPVFELAGTVDSPFGRRALARFAHRPDPGATLPDWDGTAWTDGDRSARTLVLATGGPLAAGQPAELRLGRGAPVPLDAWTARSPWQTQPALAAGIRTDARGRVIDAPGPAFAAGAALDGHDPAHDGTGLGVAVSSAVLAARGALEVVA